MILIPELSLVQGRGVYSSGGFTLVEMAVVLFILGLLIAGLLGPLETQLEARDRRQTLDTMEEIIDALYGYAITNRRLPCPNSDGDGTEQLDTDLNGTDDYDELTGAALDAVVASGGDCLNGGRVCPVRDAWSETRRRLEQSIYLPCCRTSLHDRGRRWNL